MKLLNLRSAISIRSTARGPSILKGRVCRERHISVDRPDWFGKVNDPRCHLPCIVREDTRVPIISGNRNDVLSRRRKDCGAELLFETGKRYTVSWSQK